MAGSTTGAKANNHLPYILGSSIATVLRVCIGLLAALDRRPWTGNARPCYDRSFLDVPAQPLSSELMESPEQRELCISLHQVGSSYGCCKQIVTVHVSALHSFVLPGQC